MNISSLTDTRVLTDATPRMLQQAIAQNHGELFCIEALARGGEVKSDGGFTWTYGGSNENAAVIFPVVPAEGAGAVMDTMMHYYGVHPAKSVGYWSLDPPQPADTGIRLLARGFQPGWKPCWMALDLETVMKPPSVPPALQIVKDNDTDVSNIKELPYAGTYNETSLFFEEMYPGRRQRFIALLNGHIVAQSTVFFTTGAHGVAGIYNVGVVPAARHQGIGQAITMAACVHAKEKGYRYATLNAAARELYEKIGFQWIGDGLTWWLMSKRYITHPPSSHEVAFAEAVGRGDLAALDSYAGRFTAGDLNTPVTNGMTYMELAVHCHQPAAAEWLIAHGAAYSALDAWDMGWKDRAAALLAASPQEVDRQYRDGGLTLLHIAAQRGDTALASLALSTRPDLTLKDQWHDSTPLGWAYFFRRHDIVRLIEAYQNGNK